jgi:hypothetical protein
MPARQVQLQAPVALIAAHAVHLAIQRAAWLADLEHGQGRQHHAEIGLAVHFILLALVGCEDLARVAGDVRRDIALAQQDRKILGGRRRIGLLPSRMTSRDTSNTGERG